VNAEGGYADVESYQDDQGNEAKDHNIYQRQPMLQ